MGQLSSPQLANSELEIPQSPTLPKPEGGGHDAVVWGFMGSNGGAGVTSLAVQIAYELSEGRGHILGRGDKVTRPRVCLFDLDFENGMCAPFLDVNPKLHVEDLLPGASQIDRELMEAVFANYSVSLDVLSVPQTLNGNTTADPDQVLALMDHICQLYDYVILDIPRIWTPWTHAAIGGSDQFYMVTELTVPALQSVRKKLQQIASIDGLSHVQTEILINKHERRSFRNSLRVTDAEKATNRKIFGSICTQADAVRDAINRGEPVGLTNPESRYAKDSRELLQLMVKEAEANRIDPLQVSV